MMVPQMNHKRYRIYPDICIYIHIYIDEYIPENTDKLINCTG